VRDHPTKQLNDDVYLIYAILGRAT